MSCSSCSNCSCSDCTSTPCAEVCTALVISNAWNVPACDASAVLSVPGLETVLIGSYVWNPTYGWFLLTAFDSVNFQITVKNLCFSGNAVAGTVVPAGAEFVFGAPPGATQVYFKGDSSGTAFTIPASQADVVFGTSSPTVTITSPGTYLISGGINFGPSGATTSTVTAVYLGVKRTNNSAAVLVNRAIGGFELMTAITGIMQTGMVLPLIYTTTNSNDILTLVANYTGTITSGTFVSNDAVLLAVKIS